MKKVIFCLLTICVLSAFAGPSFCQESNIISVKSRIIFYQNKIIQNENYIKSLRAKLEKANKKKAAQISGLIVKQAKVVANLKEELKKEEAKLKQLEALPGAKKETAILRPPPPQPTEALHFDVGLQGGAAVFSLSRSFSLARNVSLDPGLNIGFGNKYSLIIAKGTFYYFFKPDLFAGASIDLANYSSNVRNIVGISDVEKGNLVGIDLLFGKILDRWRVQVGYGTALGLIITGGLQI